VFFLRREKNLPPAVSQLWKIMKTVKDPRHKKREKIIKELFSFSFQTQKKQNLNPALIKKLPQIDKLIAKCAPEWPVAKLNKVDLAILRLAIFELLQKKTPKKVVIDEAVELAKQYGASSSSKFVNGVLGTVLLELNQGKKHKIND
jgi:N utilization substance protein B